METVPQQVPEMSLPEEKKTLKFSISKRILFRVGVIVLMLLVIGVGIWVFQKSSKSNEGVLVTVDKKPVYTTYLDKELEFYPGTKSAETKQILTQKVIDDQITLESAKQKGWIKEYKSGPDMSTADYLKRTQLVMDLRKKITDAGNGIHGSLVSVWFYNNGIIGPLGLERGEEMAYAKIKPLYDKVKREEITMKEAGQLIATDTSLAPLDPAYQYNAYTFFNVPEGDTVTFWPKLDAMIWNTKEGDITPLFTGGDNTPEGVYIDALYIFAQVDKKITNQDYTSYEEWLALQKKKFNITKLPADFLPRVLSLLVPSVFADDNLNNGSDHPTPDWSGYIFSQTGAPVSGAKVDIRNQVASGQVTSGANGYYYLAPQSNLNCGDAHVVITVYMNGQLCGKAEFPIPNTSSTQRHDVTCQVGPTPTPVKACNTSCSSDTECQKGDDGCPVCLPTSDGAKTCQVAPTATPIPTATPVPPTPTPTPPACGSACSDDFACAGAKDGCTWCTAGKCSPPVACGTSCTTKADCAGVRDSCTECLPNDSGTGSSCKPVPACGTSCTKDSQCAGAKNGCNICSEGGKCTAFSPDMCKCDGMDFSVAGGGTTFFPGSDVTFIAFGKVEGANINVADLQSMSFSLYQSTLSDPNKATRLAQSTAITPEIVGNTGSKVRYKVSWNQKIPTTVPSGSLFRVQATIKCVAKPGVLGASTTAGASDYYTSIVGTINGILRNTKTVLGDTTENNQQAKSFFPGAKISEKSCSIIKFYFE